MNLHEYQAKELLKKYGLPVPKNTVCSTPAEAEKAFEEFNGNPVVVKCQAYTGGRGKVGGVKVYPYQKTPEVGLPHWLQGILLKH